MIFGGGNSFLVLVFFLRVVNLVPFLLLFFFPLPCLWEGGIVFPRSDTFHLIGVR